MCFCGDSREEIDASQVRFIHNHLPDYETQRRKHVMTYDNEQRRRWEAAEAETQQRRKQLQRAISRPKPTHHRNRDGYWVKNACEHQEAPFESLVRKPVVAADTSRGNGDDDGLNSGGDGAKGPKTIPLKHRDKRREDIARRTRAALQARIVEVGK